MPPIRSDAMGGMGGIVISLVTGQQPVYWVAIESLAHVVHVAHPLFRQEVLRIPGSLLERQAECSESKVHSPGLRDFLTLWVIARESFRICAEITPRC